jgi:hypothetical protein
VSRYSARIRALEGKLAPGECRVCMGRAWDMVRVEGDDPVPPAPLCEACGKPRRQFIIHFTDDLPDEGPLMPLPVAERVEAPVDNNGRAETAGPVNGPTHAGAEPAPKPRVRRRQYSG